MKGFSKTFGMVEQPFDAFGDAVLIDRGGHMVGGGFHFVARVAHGNADGGVAKHGDVVPPVAEGHRVLQPQAEMPDDFVDAPLFGVALCRDVREGGMPAPDLALGDARGYLPFFVLDD